VANFTRVIAMILYLLLIASGFWLVHLYRNDDSVSTVGLVLIGWLPVIVGFALAWGGFEFAGRLDSRSCPQCGRRVALGTYVCSSCGFDFRRGRRNGAGALEAAEPGG
jgi:hypothetical protein